MKKFFLAAAAVLCTCYACSDGSNEFHSTYFYPQNARGIETYADQILDSVKVVSYDSWTHKNTADWVEVVTLADGKRQVNDIAVTVPAGYYSFTRLDFNMQPNTTGEIRYTPIQVTSSFEKIGTVATILTQYPYLNIAQPAVEQNADTKAFEFKLSLAATQTESRIVFTPYAGDATLTSSASWLVPEKTTDFEQYAKQTVTLQIEKNETETPRTATLTLTSRGISNVISVTQSAGKAE